MAILEAGDAGHDQRQGNLRGGEDSLGFVVADFGHKEQALDNDPNDGLEVFSVPRSRR